MWARTMVPTMAPTTSFEMLNLNHNKPTIVIHKVKLMKQWVGSQTMSSQELTQSHLVSWCSKLSYTNTGGGLFKFGFLACPTRMSGTSWVAADLQTMVPCFYSILDPKI